MESSSSNLALSHTLNSPFAPGPHRRSHPNLQHLSLAPLTPEYPITPSDYEAYINPDTMELHTSLSSSHIAELPSPGRILTNSPARNRSNSHTRLRRKTKSTVSMVLTKNNENQAPLGRMTSEGFGGDFKSELNLRLKIPTKRADPSWLVQTGLALTDGSREIKGQSWLVKRASSTSLRTPVDEPQPLPRSPYHSGRNTPNHSRRNSRERRKSKRELAMTPSTSHTQFPSGTDDPTKSTFITTGAHSQEYEEGGMKANWVDSQTQAEIAAELEGELAAELDDAELYSDHEKEYWSDGRHGTLFFEAQSESDDENEVQKAVKERGFRLGGWVDQVVNALLNIKDNENERDLDVGTVQKDDGGEARTSDEASKKAENVGSEASISDDDLEPAPDNPKSVWEDVGWFGSLLLRTAMS